MQFSSSKGYKLLHVYCRDQRCQTSKVGGQTVEGRQFDRFMFSQQRLKKEMGRKHRRDFEYAFHHVMNRASARRMIFEREGHRLAFLEILEHVVKADDIQVRFHRIWQKKYLKLKNTRQIFVTIS